MIKSFEEKNFQSVRELVNSKGFSRVLTSQVALAALFLFMMPLASARVVKGINVESLASAIKKAENFKSHPYGILKDYCSAKTEAKCRKGCVQTIQKRLRLWNGTGDFISYLSGSYAPVGAANDPLGLNRNWISNVSHFYEKEISL